MPRKRADRAPEAVYTRIGIKVSDYEARVEADINIDAKQPQYAISSDDKDRVYKYVTRLTIVGVATYPAERASQRYEVTISGDDAFSRGVHTTLKDIQLLGEYGTPKYREYRGRSVPVYRQVFGFGLLNKVRGEPAWSGWANVEPRLLTDMLILLNSRRDLYLSLVERKIGRSRWVDGVGLQTTDPSED